jgi:hypothetical protein
MDMDEDELLPFLITALNHYCPEKCSKIMISEVEEFVEEWLKDTRTCECCGRKDHG